MEGLVFVSQISGRFYVATFSLRNFIEKSKILQILSLGNAEQPQPLVFITMVKNYTEFKSLKPTLNGVFNTACYPVNKYVVYTCSNNHNYKLLCLICKFKVGLHLKKGLGKECH